MYMYLYLYLYIHIYEQFDIHVKRRIFMHTRDKEEEFSKMEVHPMGMYHLEVAEHKVCACIRSIYIYI